MTEISRTERLLAYLMLEPMTERSQQYKALRLAKAGFSDSEIADLLDTTTATVAQTLYVARYRGKAPGAGAAGKGKRPPKVRNRKERPSATTTRA